MKKKYMNRKNVNKEHYDQYIALNNFIKENYPHNSSRKFQLGYEVFGPLLVGFSEWIHENFYQKGYENLIFLARDGYIIKKAYNILYPKENTNYMYVSRKSMALPAIYKSQNREEFLDSITLPPIFTIDILLNLFDINSSKKERCLADLKISKSEIFRRDEIKENTKINQLIDALYEDIMKSAKEQYEFFNKYVEQFKIGNSISIVDIGWHNSIQLNIEKILNNSNTIINGFYVGVYDNAKKIKKGNSATGFLFNYGNNFKTQIDIFSFVSLFESMFLSEEATTLRYGKKDGIVRPILSDKNDDVDMITKKTMIEFQNGALKFVENFSEKYKGNNKLSSDVCSANLISFGCNPKSNDLKLFEKISFENYGIRNIINCNHSTIYYIFHLKMLKKDFFQSGWRIMFLKKLIKLPISYRKIFYLICKIFRRG